jgi:hypothetical protein
MADVVRLLLVGTCVVGIIAVTAAAMRDAAILVWTQIGIPATIGCSIARSVPTVIHTSSVRGAKARSPCGKIVVELPTTLLYRAGRG